MSKLIPKPIAELEVPESKGYQRNEVPVITAGLVVEIQTVKTTNGDLAAFITLDDQTGRLLVRVFSDVYAKYQNLIQPNKMVMIEGRMAEDIFTGGITATAEAIYDIAK